MDIRDDSAPASPRRYRPVQPPGAPLAPVPGQIDPFNTADRSLWFKLEHLARYLFAADYLRSLHPAHVADIACGTGYGLPALSQVAGRVLGIDENADVLAIAARRSDPENVELWQARIERGDLSQICDAGSLAAVTCFETLEHLIDPEQVIRELARTLTSDGVLLCSVPNQFFELRNHADLPANPTHKQFFSYASLATMLERNGFEVRYRLGQARSNLLFRRENELLGREQMTFRIGDNPALHTPEMIQQLATLLAYPSAEDVDNSYSIIVVAHRSSRP